MIGLALLLTYIVCAMCALLTVAIASEATRDALRAVAL